MTGPLPTAAEPFIRFAGLLREHGFVVAPDQTQSFITAVGLLGPRSITDVYRAARATLAPPHDRVSEFDALFRLLFLGHELMPHAPAMDDEDELQAVDAADGTTLLPEPDRSEDVGAQATPAERLGARQFAGVDETATLARFRRLAPGRLPMQQSRRRIGSRHGDKPDLRRTLRSFVRNDGELVVLERLRRRARQRRIVLLIDVSGSMKAQTEGYMRFAHTLVGCSERVEVFTLGTRLTRVTRALKLRSREQALLNAASIVADWDGGTRLGDALSAFLDIPRFAGFARGALVIVLSDGLERGGPEALVSATQRLSRFAWKILWLTPLAADTAYQPETDALRAVLPFIDRLGNGGDTAKLCDEVLNIDRWAA